MTVPAPLLFLRRLIADYQQNRDPGPLLGMRALDEAARLAETVGPGSDYQDDALATMALLHWYRSLLLPEPDDEPDLDRALELVSRLSPDGQLLLPGPVRQLLTASSDGPQEGAARVPLAASAALLGRDLLVSYRDSRDSDILQTALTLLQHAHRSPLPSDETTTAQALALAHYENYQRTGAAADLDQAILLTRAASVKITVGDPTRPAALSNLSAMLRTRHDQLGEVDDLDEAVASAEAAVAAAGADVPADVATNLGLARLGRFRHDRHLRDLDEAVHWLQKAVVTPSGDVDPGRWSNLAAAAQTRHMVSGELADLEMAVRAARRAVDATTEDHPDRARYLSNLALALGSRHAATADSAGLDAAVHAFRRAVDLIPADHPDRGRYLSNLALALGSRHAATGDPADLDAAVHAAHQAVVATAAGRPDLTDRLVIAGELLGAQGRDADAARRFREAALHPSGLPSSRVAAAQAWARLAATRGDHREALHGFTLATELVPLLVSRELRGPDRLRNVQGLAPRDVADAVASALHAGEPLRALELWEQARGMVLEQELQLRTDLTALADADSELAGQLEAVRRRLDVAVPRAGREDADLRIRIARQWDRLVRQVRELPAFENFLQPPRAESLLVAGLKGPVVLLNVSQYRSDAIIIVGDGIQVVALPGVTPDLVHARAAQFLAISSRAASEDITDQLSELLSWLWERIAEPVLGHLAITEAPRTGSSPPRLWWCPGGELALLPLHAAGRPDRPHASVPDRVVSSYTPTVRALIEARSRLRPPRMGDTVVGVGMAHTPGLASLPESRRELSTLAKLFPKSLTELADGAATRDAVASAIQDGGILHLACHAWTNPADPRASSLHLSDGVLTVSDILALRPSTAELVFLSACETGTSSSISDEPVSLASAMLFSGYRHAVATLWPVTDFGAARLAERFYAALARHGYDPDSVAVALNGAVRSLRHERPHRPLDWLAYIHLGP